MQGREDPLRREVTIGDETDEQRRNDGRYSGRSVDKTNLSTFECQCLAEVGAQRDGPRAPDKNWMNIIMDKLVLM